jgi:hypothetical protein
MPNQINGSGIQIETYPEIVSGIINGEPSVPGLVSIYGADINTGSNTPDGNLINIFALSKEDVLQLCVSIFDSFDPDQAVGVALDNLSQLCGIARKGGSYTRTNIVLTATQAVNLVGLNNPGATPFTISDANGNQFNLLISQTIASYGTYTYAFQAANVGYIQVIPNTITNIVTITPGVAAVNNPNAPTLVGEDQETDAAFRLRRQQSISLPAQGSFYGLYAGLLTINGLNQALVYVNNTSGVDAHSVPANSIWVIVDGGSAADVGNMIYKYLSLGCGMKGTGTYSITQADSTIFTVKYDNAIYQNFYAQMTLSSKGGLAIDKTAVATYLSNNYILGIYQAADITAIDSLIHVFSPDLVMALAGVSLTNGSYGTSVLPSSFAGKLVLPSANITINT